MGQFNIGRGCDEAVQNENEYLRKRINNLIEQNKFLIDRLNNLESNIKNNIRKNLKLTKEQPDGYIPYMEYSFTVKTHISMPPRDTLKGQLSDIYAIDYVVQHMYDYLASKEKENDNE